MVPNETTIAVTGGSGFIGLQLLPLLLKKGYRLRVLNRRLLQETPGMTQIQGDVRSPDAARLLTQGCGAVIHLAGIAHTSLHSQAEREEAEEINVGGARNLLAAARDAGVGRALVVSSAHVYAGQEGIDLDEKSVTAGDSFYARTKLMVEREGLENAAASRMSVVIARPCLTYGPGVRFNLESLMRAIRGHYYFQIRGSNPMRSFLSVSNAAAGIMHLLEAGESGTIYNLADRDPLPLGEFVDSLADLMQVSRPWNLPIYAVRAAIAGAAPLQWCGLQLPVNHESLRKLTVSFTLNVTRLAASGFQWPDVGLSARASMVKAYLASCKQ